MDNHIRRLIDREAVVDTINSLFVAVDESDWSTVRKRFAPRFEFDMSSMTGERPGTLGIDEIIDAWKAGLGPLKAVHHQTGNYRVELKGSEADASCYGIAYHYLPNPTGQHTRVFVGTYDFHLAKLDDGWRIDAFRFTLKFIDGNPDLEKSG